MPHVTIPPRLSENVRDGLCIPWCGAGASVASGLPVWDELVVEFIEACEGNGLGSEELEQLEGLRQAGYRDDVVHYCRKYLGEGEYRNFLTKTLAKGEPSPTHRELAKLPVPAMLTSNYDPLLERAIAEEKGTFPTVLTNHDTSSLWQRFARREFFLLKVHGHIDRPDTIVLTTSDYSEHVFGNVAFMQFLQRLFFSTSVLFVGTSLRDEYLRRILDEGMFLTRGVGMPHFAIQMFTGPIHAELLRDRFNIRVLTAPSEEAIPEILADIREQAAPTLEPA